MINVAVCLDSRWYIHGVLYCAALPCSVAALAGSPRTSLGTSTTSTNPQVQAATTLWLTQRHADFLAVHLVTPVAPYTYQ